MVPESVAVTPKARLSLPVHAVRLKRLFGPAVPDETFRPAENVARLIVDIDRHLPRLHNSEHHNDGRD